MESLRAEQRRREAEIERQQTAFFEQQKKMQGLQKQRNEAERRQLELQKELDSENALRSRLTTLIEETEKAKANAEAAERAAGPLQRSLRRLDQEIKKKHESVVDEMSRCQAVVNKRAEGLARLERMGSELREYESGGTETELRRAQERQEQLSGEKERLKEALRETEQGLRGAHDGLQHEEPRRRELEDCEKLLMREAEESGLLAEVGKLRGSLGALADVDVGEERGRLQTRVERLDKRLSERKGRLTTERENMLRIEADLSKPLMADAASMYKSRLAAKVVKEGVVRDLDKYATAVAEGVVAVHSARMSELNEILGRLWMETYRGADIATVKVVAEDTGEAAKAGTGLTKHNYRVLMRKGLGGGGWLDMRTHCSAGQRVLACILIRVALAEVFSRSVGFLVLDEPTTNLDEENSANLAASLAHLVRRNNLQLASSFQLLLITHDAHFVEQLVNAQSEANLVPDFFFRVHKDTQGRSRLSRVTHLDQPFHPPDYDSQFQNAYDC